MINVGAPSDVTRAGTLLAAAIGIVAAECDLTVDEALDLLCVEGVGLRIDLDRLAERIVRAGSLHDER